MTSEYLCRKAGKIKSRYGRLEPLRLAEEMQILVLREPMGRGEHAVKGFFMIIAKQPVIAVNTDLSEDMQRVVVMHEIGHAVARHGVERMGTETMVNVVGSVIGSSVSEANADAVLAAYRKTQDLGK